MRKFSLNEARERDGVFEMDKARTCESPQALMDAVVKELGEQVSLECLLKRCEGMLEYQSKVPANGYFVGHGQGSIGLYHTTYSLDAFSGTRLVFTPPAPKEDTLAERARKLAERKHDGLKWEMEVTALLAEIAEKVEGGKE